MTVPSRVPAPARFDPSMYAGLGALGVVLLVLGVWYTALQGVPYAGYLRIGLAIVGGYLTVLGWARWYQLRDEPRRRGPLPKNRPVPGLPSMEIYSPNQKDARSPPEREMAPVPTLVRPHRRAPLYALALAALVGVLILSALSPSAFVASASSASPGHPAPATGASHLASTPERSGSGSPHPLSPPTITCVPGAYPLYGPINGLYPPLPYYASQKPCRVAHDEVHTTFSSTAVGSGEEVRVPIYLPEGGLPGQSVTYSDFYFGMVVGGETSSVDGQSYAQIVFQPQGVGSSGTWNISVTVWSLLMNTSCTTGFNFSWLNYFGCEVDEVGGGNGANLEKNVPGGQFTNLTLGGDSSSSTTPLRLWLNDSTNSLYTVNYTFSAAKTGSVTFHPYYASACPDACLLNWSMPFGLGMGVDLCDMPLAPVCFSYNATQQAGLPPFTVGSPEYWVTHHVGGAYNGDYRYFSPESSTGACSAAGGVPPCDPAAQAGSYPFFTFNGTAINFGTNWTWTTEDFGGAVFEFNGAATANDYTPLWVDEFSNTSRAGFLAPGLALNVTVRVQDLGNVSLVNLSYTEPGGGPTNSTMVRVSGTDSDGIYNGTVPASGGNGVVSFRVWATNNASALVALPTIGTPPSTVLRGPIPTFHVTVDSLPATCGGVSLNGSAFRGNGSVFSLEAGSYSARANGCYSYRFSGWEATGGVSVAGSGPAVSVTLRGNGTLAALWQYLRPVDSVTLAWSPASCGETILNGSGYLAPGPASVELLDNGSYSLGTIPCGGDSFAGWTVSSGAVLAILGSELTLHGNGTLTANFEPTSTSAPVTFLTTPAGCGGVLLRNVGYAENQTINLIPGSYPISPDPCGGYGWAGAVTVTGGLAVAGGELTVSGGGTVDYQYYKLTLVSILTYPSGCGGILWDGVAEVGGALLNVSNHTDHAIASDPCAGSYLIGFLVTGNLTLLGSVVAVNGPGSVEAIYRAGTPQYFVGFITEPSGCGSIIFNGTAYLDSQYLDVAPNSVVRVGTFACPDYGFVQWVVNGGIQIWAGVAYVNESGSIEAIFHPLVSVLVQTAPSNCGEVNLSGQIYANGATALLPEDAVYSIAAVPCVHETLSSWIVTTGANISNGSISLIASAIVTAEFAPAFYSVALFVVSDGCGEVTVNGVQYANNTTLSLLAGTYPIASDLCAGYALSNWSLTGALSVNASGLIVNGSGSLTEVGAAVPPSVSVTAPATAATGGSVLFTATVHVPVPPYDYNYSWNFGDGSPLVNSSADFASHTYTSTGTYTVTVTVVDPLHRSASSSVSLTVVAPPSGLSLGLTGTTTVVLIGVVLLVLVAVGVAVGMARRRSSADRERESPDEPPPSTWTDESPPGPGGGGSS